LAFQIHEREALRRLKELQDKQFAEDVKNRVLTEEQNDMAKKEALKQRMNMYKQDLTG
jgi:hypothetical protein